jgi:hypothetical protein
MYSFDSVNSMIKPALAKTKKCNNPAKKAITQKLPKHKHKIIQAIPEGFKGKIKCIICGQVFDFDACNPEDIKKLAFQPAIYDSTNYCNPNSLQSALKLLAEMQTGIRFCGNPKCDKPAGTERNSEEKKKYCSEECQTDMKLSRQYQKKRKKPQSVTPFPQNLFKDMPKKSDYSDNKAFNKNIEAFYERVENTPIKCTVEGCTKTVPYSRRKKGLTTCSACCSRKISRKTT